MVIATQRADIASRCDYLLLLDKGIARFLGTPQGLLDSKGGSTLHVMTKSQEGVKALVSPLQIKVEEHDEGISFSAPNGQEIAARLITEGYGDVDLVVVRRPALTEVVRTALR